MHRRNVAKTAKPKKTRCRRCIFAVLELIVGIGRKSFSRHLSKAGRLLAHSAKTFWSPMKNRSIYHMHMYVYQKTHGSAYFISAQNPQVDALKTRRLLYVLPAEIWSTLKTRDGKYAPTRKKLKIIRRTYNKYPPIARIVSLSAGRADDRAEAPANVQ